MEQAGGVNGDSALQLGAPGESLGSGPFLRIVSSGVFGITNRTLKDRKSTRLNSSHRCISYAVFCLKKKKKIRIKAALHVSNASGESSLLFLTDRSHLTL